jgi:hypothetical protein
LSPFTLGPIGCVSQGPSAIGSWLSLSWTRLTGLSSRQTVINTVINKDKIYQTKAYCQVLFPIVLWVLPT